MVVISACGAQTATPPTITPTAIARNADWTPIVETVAGIEMVRVPAGCFTMGSDTGRRDERPAHRQCLPTYWIDRTEITNGQYGGAGNFGGANRPRENLTWLEAVAFCAKRGARLPTEAEWEYAARGPDSLIYPWGNALDPDRLVYDKNMDAANSFPTADVGSRPNGASWVGALDLSGNVWEWTHSAFRPYPYKANDGREAEQETVDPPPQRVYRGGWQSYIDNATGATMRFRKNADERDWHIGFRCVMTRQ